MPHHSRCSDTTPLLRNSLVFFHFSHLQLRYVSRRQLGKVVETYQIAVSLRRERPLDLDPLYPIRKLYSGCIRRHLVVCLREKFHIGPDLNTVFVAFIIDLPWAVL
jgi:hypothetical protein